MSTRIETDGVCEWDVDAEIEWYPGEQDFVRRLPVQSQWAVMWAKRLRKPVDGRCFKIVGDGKSGYGFVRVKD